MEAKVYPICFLGINLNHSFTYQPDEAHASSLRLLLQGKMQTPPEGHSYKGNEPFLNIPQYFIQ
jgi:hypothetical protein